MAKRFSTAQWVRTGIRTAFLFLAFVGAAGGDEPVRAMESVLAGSAEESAPPSPPLPAPPALHMREPRVDLGSVFSGTYVRHRFVYENRGGSELVVQRLRPMCGTLVERWDRKDRALAPGGEGSFVLAFDTGGVRGGRRIFRASVESNDPQNPRIFVRMEVRVVPVFTIEPASPRIDLLPDTPAGEVVITLARSEAVKDEVRILKVRSRGQRVKLNLAETEPGSTWTLLARTDRFPEERSYVADRVVLEVQVGDQRLEQKLSVLIRRRERIEASPRSVYFKRRTVETLAAKGTPVTKTVTIGTVLDPPYRFRISGVRVDGPDGFEALFKTRIEPVAEGREYRLTVELVALPAWIENPDSPEPPEKAEQTEKRGKPTAGKSRLLAGTITLLTDDPKRAEIRVRCAASVGAASPGKGALERQEL